MQAWLDAPVRKAAVVYVNDQKAGSVWCPPYAVDVTPFLRAGNNRIKILVANSAVNYMSGRRLPDYRLLNLRYGERLGAGHGKVQAIPAGFLGSIRLIVAPKSDVTFLRSGATAKRLGSLHLCAAVGENQIWWPAWTAHSVTMTWTG